MKTTYTTTRKVQNMAPPFVNTFENEGAMRGYVQDAVQSGLTESVTITINRAPATQEEAVQAIANFIKSDAYNDETYEDTYQRILEIINEVEDK